jgi:transmembrane sensor
MNNQIYEEASEWLVDLRTEEVDAGARQRFETWLATSPEHVRAYLELSGVWEVVSASSPADASSVDALIARARAVSNVVPLEHAKADETRDRESAAAPAPRHRRMPRGLWAVAASILIAVVMMGVWRYVQRDTYSTAIGEQRSILLSDGSTIELNARSSVRVRYSEAQRDIELLTGQALFQVAKDKRRPFVVKSDQTRVRAVGTRFDVNQRRRTTIVTVVEGTVSVGASTPPTPGSGATEGSAAVDAASREFLLTAGEQAILTSGAPLPPKHADVTTATAWTERRLIFEATPLDEVAEEFNRNNARQLVIEGEGLEDFHISGAFSSSDPEPLLRFLRAQQGIQIREQRERIVVSRSL